VTKEVNLWVSKDRMTLLKKFFLRSAKNSNHACVHQFYWSKCNIPKAWATRIKNLVTIGISNLWCKYKATKLTLVTI